FPSAEFDNDIDGRHHNRNELIKKQWSYLDYCCFSLAGESNGLDSIKTDPGVIVPQGLQKFRRAATRLSKAYHCGLPYICIPLSQKLNKPRVGPVGPYPAQAVYGGNFYFLVGVHYQTQKKIFIRYCLCNNLADKATVTGNAGKEPDCIYFKQRFN